MKTLAYFTVPALLLGAALAQEAPRPPEVYLTPMSHLDFYWGGTREECLARGNEIIAQVVRLARQSAQFRFLLEDEDFVANYVETHKGTDELASFRQFVREGRIEVAPKWAAIFQGLPDGEVQARNLVIGKRYARDVLGVDPQVAHLGDLPDYTLQFPQLLAQAHVPYMVMTRMGPSHHSLFFWKAPDGSRALVWNTIKGYGWGTFLTSKTTTGEQKRARFEKEVAQIGPTAPGPIMLNWGTDLWAPPDDFIERIDEFSRIAPAKLIMATPSDFFHHAEKTPGIAELSGEINSSWPNIVSSLPHLWPQIIPATNTLLAAEKFATIDYALGYAGYPNDFDLLWKKLVESMDHNHDGQGGALADWRKAEYEQLARIRGGEILRDSLRNIAERVTVPIPNSFPIVVFNPLGWSRDDVVRTHVALFGIPAPADIAPFKKGMRLLDETGRPVPFRVEEYSENISRSLELVFVARNVPSLGYRTYYLTAADAPESSPAAAQVQLDSDKDRRDPRRPLGSDVLENAFYRLTIDCATGRVSLFDKDLGRDVLRDMEISAAEERGGNYIGVEPLSGRTIPAVADDIRVEENNSVRAVVRLALRIADIPIVQRLTLYRDLKRLDIENSVEWKSPRLFRIEQSFPVAQEKPAYEYGVPFGANSVENILPNAGPHQSDEISVEDWRRSRHIHDWIHAAGGGWGLTIATDHQQVRLDEHIVRAEMVRGTRFTSVKVVRDGQASAQQYPPLGTYTFRYSISSAAGDWRAAKAYRAGMGLTNPLLPISVVDTLSHKTLPPSQSFFSTEQPDLVLSALKKADRDNSLIVRVYEIEGAPVHTPVRLLGKPAVFTETDLLEEDTAPQMRRTLQSGPYTIRTLRVRQPTR
jgi:alpha-mannosidase